MLIVDAGRCQWACGYAYDDGPSVLLPAPAAPDGDREAIRAQVLAAFEELLPALMFMMPLTVLPLFIVFVTAYLDPRRAHARSVPDAA